MKDNRYSVPNGIEFIAPGLSKKMFLKLGLEETYLRLCKSYAEKEVYKTQHAYDYGMSIMQASLICLHNRYTGEGLHVFLETKHLFDFFIDTEIKDINIAYDFIDKYYSKEENGMILNPDGTKTETDSVRVCSIFIHHKHLNKPSYQYNLSYFVKKDGTKELSSLVLIDEISSISFHMHNKEQANELGARLFYNLLFYAEAFPECFVDGTPDEKRKFFNFYHAKNRFKLKTHESLVDRSGVTPHLRRGHFRRLESEYYKKKKGQVIFIHSTMIKGKAKTVKENTK